MPDGSEARTTKLLAHPDVKTEVGQIEHKEAVRQDALPRRGEWVFATVDAQGKEQADHAARHSSRAANPL